MRLGRTAANRMDTDRMLNHIHRTNRNRPLRFSLPYLDALQRGPDYTDELLARHARRLPAGTLHITSKIDPPDTVTITLEWLPV